MKRRFAILLGSLAIVLMGCTAMEGAMTHDEPLVNTYWKLTQVGDATPEAVDNQREAHFVLHTEENRIAGSTGCNHLAGNYRLDNDALHFGPLITTRMACLQGGETEQAMAFGPDGQKAARLTACVDAAPVFNLRRTDAEQIVDRCVTVVQEQFDDACADCGVSPATRDLLLRGPVLHPSVFYPTV